ncbi:MAG: hypothetical protein Q8P67_17600, partial [archaeon]|nr:hypothetical protein [archaeon]
MGIDALWRLNEARLLLSLLPLQKRWEHNMESGRDCSLVWMSPKKNPPLVSMPPRASLSSYRQSFGLLEAHPPRPDSSSP